MYTYFFFQLLLHFSYNHYFKIIQITMLQLCCYSNSKISYQTNARTEIIGLLISVNMLIIHQRIKIIMFVRYYIIILFIQLNETKTMSFPYGFVNYQNKSARRYTRSRKRIYIYYTICGTG